MRVLYLTNIPSPYRVEFFNELGKKCDLTVLFERDRASDRDKNWNSNQAMEFKTVFLSGKNTRADAAFCPGVIKYLSKKKYDIFVVGGYSTPTGMLAIEILRLKRIPFFLNCDGGMIKHDGFIRYKIKKHFISSASVWLSTGKKTDEYLLYYGARKNRIVHYPFTSISQKDIWSGENREKDRKNAREELGIMEDKVILAVGQFIYRKGFDLLIEMMGRMKRGQKNFEDESQNEVSVGLYLVGGKPTKEYIELMNKYSIKNVHFVDFMSKDDVRKYYISADIFVSPTREDIWGLVINEAMAAGLPVITTDQCVAGIELINDGKNGLIVESDNIDELQRTTVYLLNDGEKCKKMGKTNLKLSQSKTVEHMVIKHYSAFRKIKN